MREGTQATQNRMEDILEEGNSTGATDQQNEIIGDEKEATESAVQEVVDAATPLDPPPTLRQIGGTRHGALIRWRLEVLGKSTQRVSVMFVQR
jgi:hypothetical protein